MSGSFAAGKKALGICDRCGFQYKLKDLKPIPIKTKQVNILVCPTCWEPDHPQLQVGMYVIEDPQALRNPRPDTSYVQSRATQWGFNPVGVSDPHGLNLPNNLVATGLVGTVTVTVS